MGSTIQAALQIYEILEAILLELPDVEIPRATTVCKAWHKVISDSVRLRRACIFDHLRPTTQQDGPSGQQPQIWIPAYQPSAIFHLNPVFGTACDYFNIDGVRTTRLFIYPASIPRLRGERDAFATLPPCTTILLETYGRAKPCMVYVKNGIKIRDLLDCARMLCEGAEMEAAHRELRHPLVNVQGNAIGKFIGCSIAPTREEAEKEFEAAELLKKMKSKSQKGEAVAAVRRRRRKN